jgi:hypothetical protein
MGIHEVDWAFVLCIRIGNSDAAFQKPFDYWRLPALWVNGRAIKRAKQRKISSISNSIQNYQFWCTALPKKPMKTACKSTREPHGREVK